MIDKKLLSILAVWIVFAAVSIGLIYWSHTIKDKSCPHLSRSNSNDSDLGTGYALGSMRVVK